jgi:hypothetical protein
MGIVESIKEYNSDAIFWDGLDEAIIGMTTNGNVVYDITKVHKILMARHKMSLDQAVDFAEDNILYTPLADFSPIHIITFK